MMNDIRPSFKNTMQKQNNFRSYKAFKKYEGWAKFNKWVIKFYNLSTSKRQESKNMPLFIRKKGKNYFLKNQKS